MKKDRDLNNRHDSQPHKAQDGNALAHLHEQERLLTMEYQAERDEYETMCRTVGIRRRIRQGRCWYPIGVGRTFYNALDQFCIEVTAPEEIQQSDTEFEFEPGRPVAFFHTEPGDPTAMASAQAGITFIAGQAQVSRTDGVRMHIALPSSAVADALRHWAMQGALGVQLSFDATSHRVMRDAIQRVRSTDDHRLLHLRDVLIGPAHPGFRSEQPVSFPWLNPSQGRAVQRVLCAREVAIVHGPPGTGKTTTLVEAIDETLQREAQVLVCAQSNAAVDWIAGQLLAQGISVLRVGNPARVSDQLLASTYERRFEAHPDYTELWAIRKECRTLVGRLGARNMSASQRQSTRNRLDKLRSRQQELEVRIDEDLFLHTRVIACTLIGTQSRVLERKHFPTLFIDEAAQAFEAACWAAIIKADRVIFAGDHRQLPPTIKSREAERAGLGRTLMETVARQKPECVELLTEQYRMHRDIMRFSSEWFYGGRLTAAPQVADHLIFPLDTPLVWVDTARLGYEEEQNPLSQSRLNTAEAALLIDTLTHYVGQIGVERLIDGRIDFGIISPYKSQVQLLRHLVRTSPALRPLRHCITAGTVDGFQGQERDVILLSMVRGNDEGRIGFLGDLRRMNVAITRARMKLIILGDTGTLAHTPFYRRLIEHVEQHGQMIVVEPPAEPQNAAEP